MTLRASSSASCLAAFAVAALFSVATPRLAHADAVPPDAYACDTNAAPGHFDSSKIGSSCKLPSGESGACAKSTCSGIDYSKWDRDAGTAPPSVTFDCLKCTAGAPSSSSSGGDGGPSASSSGSSSSSDGGCSIVRTPPFRAAAPWLVALVVPALAFLTRKRKDRTRP